METQRATDWRAVRDNLKAAKLVAWDGCHKIYVAMDEEQARWFTENYSPDVFRGTPSKMLAKLRSWYGKSCPLRFIDGVETNHADRNAGFFTLIPQD